MSSNVWFYITICWRGSPTGKVVRKTTKVSTHHFNFLSQKASPKGEYSLISHADEELLELPNAHNAIVVLVKRFEHDFSLAFVQSELGLEHVDRVRLVQVSDIVLHIPIKEFDDVLPEKKNGGQR